MTAGEPENEDRDVDRGQDLPELDYDAAFAALVARFGEAPDVDLPAETPVDRAPPDTGSTSGTGSTDGTSGTESWYPPELDEHFEPPEPPPIPRGDLVSRLAWSGVLGGPAVLLVAAVVNGALPSWMVLGALLSFVAGFVALVARMPAERPDDGDNGAVV